MKSDPTRTKLSLGRPSLLSLALPWRKNLKIRAPSIALVTGLSLCTSVRAADLVGTWLTPAPNAYYYPGQEISGYPNSDAFTERVLFTRENGILKGIAILESGEEHLSDVKLKGASISFVESNVRIHGEIHGNELQLN